MKTEFEPILYLFMRSDIPDMNPGKGMAQACHAGNQVTSYLADNSLAKPHYEKWIGNRTFGTTITLMADLESIEKYCDPRYRKVRDNFDSGVIVDPTYPIRGYYGNVFTREEITCGWVFVFDENWKYLDEVKQMELHP